MQLFCTNYVKLIFMRWVDPRKFQLWFEDWGRSRSRSLFESPRCTVWKWRWSPLGEGHDCIHHVECKNSFDTNSQTFRPLSTSDIVVYASKWAISAALIQEHDGVYWPVRFTSRTRKSNEINYGTVEKKVLALLRMLDVCYTTLVSREVKVLTRHSTLSWLVRSSGLNGRLGRWAALLSNWTL